MALELVVLWWRGWWCSCSRDGTMVAEVAVRGSCGGIAVIVVVVLVAW